MTRKTAQTCKGKLPKLLIPCAALALIALLPPGADVQAQQAAEDVQAAAEVKPGEVSNAGTINRADLPSAVSGGYSGCLDLRLEHGILRDNKGLGGCEE